jgi:uncharacterized protein (TIGR02001 family)
MATNRAWHAVGTMSAAVLPMLPCAAVAEGLSGSVAVTTDYIYRGLSQTGGNPAIQGGVQWQWPAGWNAGVWSSTVEFTPDRGPRFEVDAHAGRAWSLNTDWSARIGWTHYFYPDDEGLEYEYDELSAAISFQQRVTATIAWSPNASRFGYGERVSDRRAIAYELTALQPLTPRWSVCAGVGYSDLRDLFGAGYWYWNAGVTFIWDALQVDLMRIDNDETARELFGNQAGGGQWTAALSWRF